MSTETATNRVRGLVRGGILLPGTPLATPLTSLIVPVVAALGGLAFFIWRPGIALGAVESPRAFGFTAGVGLLVILLGWGLPRLRAPVVLTMLAQLVPVVLAFVVTVLPAFRVVSIDEAVPPAMASASPGPSASSGSSAGSPTPDAPAAEGAQLRGIDHDATGTVRLLQAPDGSTVVRFENLDVEPGPDYFVHLVPGADQERPGDRTSLGGLRANRGNQNYPAPATDVTNRPVTVLIWCRAFAVPIAAATFA